MGRANKKSQKVRKVLGILHPVKFSILFFAILMVILIVLYRIQATHTRISDSINPAIAPKPLLNTSPKLYISDTASEQSGWVTPQDQSWTSGYSYQIPSDWGPPTEGDGGCGPTYTPKNQDSNHVWIYLCGPDINGYQESTYWNTRMQQGRIIEKKKTFINGNPAIYSISQENGGTWSSEYFLYINTIIHFAGSISQQKTGAMWIGLTAGSQEKLNEYLPIFDQFINKVSIANKDKLNQLSGTSCEMGKPVMENKIAQFEHAQYSHDVKGIFTILNERLPETTAETEAQKSIADRLFKYDDLSYSLVTYKFTGVDVYLPGMCIVHVQEDRKVTIHNQLQQIMYPRNFIFSDFGRKWEIEGYYGSDVEFGDRISGFYNIGFSDNRNMFRKFP